MYNVRESQFDSSNKLLTPLRFIIQLIYLFINIWGCKMIVCQFSGYHSFLPVIFSKILNKPSLIISGGTDCVAFPSIGYGNFNKNFLGLFTAFSFKYCTHISPVHQSLMISDYTYQTNDYSQQGLLFFHPEIRTPYTVIYNGYDSSKWCRVKEKRKNLFLTVAAGLYMPFSKQLKGIDLILEIANDFPQCEFMIIGADEKIMNCGISNLIGIPYVENEKLPEYYSQAEFYLQLSMSEGFPNALCEAMLCECVPIASNVSSMPGIISNSGYVLMKRDVNELKQLISKAISVDTKNLSKTARENIVKKYPEKKREEELIALLNQMMNKS